MKGIDMELKVTICVLYFAVVNLAAFVAFGMDKRRALRQKWRIPERTLLGIAAAGGAVGALLGMHIFHHKTRKLKFSLGVPVFLAMHVLVIYIVFR
ncbi:DUF1294 domain-containing protein [Roseburia hominis]